MIYLHYKDTKTFGHSFSFLLIFKTLRASYLQVGNFSTISCPVKYTEHFCDVGQCWGKKYSDCDDRQPLHC